MEEQKVKTEPVKTQRRIALSTDEMRLYLESQGVICNKANKNIEKDDNSFSIHI